MSLAEAETAVVELVADALVNDCGRPIPDRLLRYHGVLPHDCCSDAGFVAVHWEQGYPSLGFPTSAATREEPCPGFPVFVLVVRYVVCWPAADATDGGVLVSPEQDARWDEIAAMLADVALCVAMRLHEATCAGVARNSVLGESMTRLRYSECTPILPQGLCAGVQWKLYVAPRPGTVS